MTWAGYVTSSASTRIKLPARVADRLAPPFGGQPALVERVAGLVQHAHERAVEIRLLIARGEADIVGSAAAERVQADIEPAMGEIEAEPLHELEAELALGRDRKRARQGQRRRPGALALQRSVDEPGEKSCDLVEQAIDGGDAAARLILVEQRLVGRLAERRGFRRRHLADHGQHATELRQHGREVAGGTRLAPAHLAGRARLRQRLHQIGRHRGGVHPAPAHFREVGALPGIEVVLRAGTAEQVRERRVGEHFVTHDLQRRELLRPCGGAAGRHQCGGVPMEDGRRLLQRAEPGEARFEGLVRARGQAGSPCARRRMKRM